MVDQAEIHKMARSEDVKERRKAVNGLQIKFAILMNKEQAWDELLGFTQDEDKDVRLGATSALGRTFSYMLDKNQAWKDLLRLTSNNQGQICRGAVIALGMAFSHMPDKQKGWYDLHNLISDNDNFVRWGAARALGGCYSHIPDEYRKQAWEDLHRLTSDTDWKVRITANHSLGKVSIFRATESESEGNFRKEIENALVFFEKASNEDIFFNPASFCLPFYRSFYMLTFKKEETEAEVQRYIAEAKSVVEGSENKEKLLEAVESLGNALNEAHKARDFSDVKADLNAYRRYCDRACELLDTTEEKAPGASRLIRKGLPIIDEKIKGIIGCGIDQL